METLIATVEGVRFQNEENGFVIFEGTDFEKKSKGFFNIKGYVKNVTDGDIIQCLGFWGDNPKFGKTFEAKEISLYTPNTEEKILMYLSSGYIRGINKSIARRLVDKFGKDTIKVLDNNPEKIASISGVGSVTLKKIIDDWSEKRLSHKQAEELRDLGFTFQEAFDISNYMEDGGLKVLLDNPYGLLRVSGLTIPFERVDEIAVKKLRVAKDNEMRILSYLISVVKSSESSGNTCIDKKKLLSDGVKYLGVEKERVELLLDAAQKMEILTEYNEAEFSWIQLNDTAKVEEEIVERLMALKNGNKKNHYNIERNIERYSEAGKPLSIEQSAALIGSLTNNVSVINGGPGVGKTMSLGVLVKIIKNSGYSFKLCAQTGLAAQRMSESTGEKAQTIHKMLEYNPSLGGFAVNEKKTLDADYIIVDETSMLDIFLFLSLLKAIREGSSLILIGDVDQIPSISAGMVLRDIIESNCIHVSKIKELQRQAKDSVIIQNAYRVNDGEDIQYENKPDGDFFFIKTKNDRSTLEKIKTMIGTKIEKAFNYSPKDDVQTLTPIHKEVLGRKNLNNEIQSLLNNSEKLCVKRGDVTFKLNDKVMQIKNNYEQDLMNGDCGLISNIRGDNVMVDFNGLQGKYKKNKLDQLELSYAVTMHKSQGSEYPVIIIPISHLYCGLLDRSLLYTAMTRGKKLVILIGSESRLKESIKNDFSRRRKTLMKSRLINYQSM